MLVAVATIIQASTAIEAIRMEVTKLVGSEVQEVQSAMRDVQVSIAEYYRQTGGFVGDPVQYTTPIRACVSFIQKVHEVLQRKITNSLTYREQFKARLEADDQGAAVIQGLKYVRNVGLHHLHPVTPSTGRIVGNNLGLGFRTSSFWTDVPAETHAQLQTRTQALREHFAATVVGRPTLDPLLDACAHFLAMCPEAIHRADEGHWTSFPLRIQWGTSGRIHPEEPEHDGEDRQASDEAIRSWLDSRPPGGSFRWICGAQAADGGQGRVCGWTFRTVPGVGAFAFLPFWETIAQVERDCALGYRYFEGDCGDNVRVDPELKDKTGATFYPVALRAAIEDWAVPVHGRPLTPVGSVCGPDVDWSYELHADKVDLTVRRARRMDAWYPIF